jgi:hypothetical protein
MSKDFEVILPPPILSATVGDRDGEIGSWARVL